MKNLLLTLLLAAICPSSLLLAEASGSIRKNKTIMIESHLGFNGAGAGLGIFLPNDNRLDLSTSNSDAMIFAFENKVYKLEFQSFVANSFYYAMGVNYRTIKDPYYFSYFYEQTYLAEIEAVHAHFVIGNEWGFRYFFIGAEWVGLSSPLSYSYTINYPETATEVDREYWEKDAQKTGARSVLTLPNLYIGFAF